MKILKKIIPDLIIFIICSILLFVSIRGLAGTPNAKELNQLIWKDNGPLELSPERGRFALIYSLAEDKSFSFSVPLAQFAAPDVGYLSGKYVSLFAPGISFIVMPGYFIGKLFGLSQIGSFAVIAFFAVCNVFLIQRLSVLLGASRFAGYLGGLLFLFATPAFSYSLSLYQHHISTFLILSCLYLLIRYSSAISLFFVWILYGISLSVDYPNFVLMLPVVLLALYKTFIFIKEKQVFRISVPITRLLAAAGIILPLVFFFWFNMSAYGNPLQLSGTVERALKVNNQGKPFLERSLVNKNNLDNIDVKNKSATGFFEPSKMLNGFYIFLFSPDRGVIVYTPVMFFGVFGLYLAYKKRLPYFLVFLGIASLNIIFYSMWDDPFGGWAFGSRYLIPSYAILSIFIALFLTQFKKRYYLILLFYIISCYSISISTLGALTTNQNPPKIEWDSMTKDMQGKFNYTYLRNISLLDQDVSKSFIYKTYLSHYITAWDFYIDTTFSIILLNSFLLLVLSAEKQTVEAKELFKIDTKTKQVTKKQIAYAV